MAGLDQAPQVASGQPGDDGQDGPQQQQQQTRAAGPQEGAIAGSAAGASTPDRPDNTEEGEQEGAGADVTSGEPAAEASWEQRQGGAVQSDSTGPDHQQQRQQQLEEQQAGSEDNQRQQEEVKEAQQEDTAAASARDAAALARAEAFKAEGNELFGRGLWDEAAAKYNEALDAAPRSAAKQQAIYFANLAACNIKSKQYTVAVQHCTEAIRLDGSYQKALMRRCEALERLDELEAALKDAQQALSLDPGSSWARDKAAALQAQVDERTAKLKAEMFGKLKEIGNMFLGNFGLSVDNFKLDKDPSTGSYNIRFER